MQAISQKLTTAGRIVSTMQKLPPGVAGTQKTLALIHESVVDTVTSEAVINTALVAANIANRAPNARTEIQRVQKWVQKNIQYVLDPLSIELLQSPTVTLKRRQGDCDDQTALMCALLSALGYVCRMVAIGFKKGTYAHVYCEVQIDGKWTAAETIKPWALGVTAPGVVETMQMIVNVEKGAALSGIFSKIKKTVAPIGKKIINNPITRTAAAAYTGGASEVYYQGRDILRDKKATAGNTPPVVAQPATDAATAPPSPLPAAAVVAVVPAAVPVVDQVKAYAKSNPIPAAIGAGVLLLLLLRR